MSTLKALHSLYRHPSQNFVTTLSNRSFTHQISIVPRSRYSPPSSCLKTSSIRSKSRKGSNFELNLRASPSGTASFFSRSDLDRERRSDWRRNGTPEITLGFTLLVLLGVDHLLQNGQERERSKIIKDLQLAIESDELQQAEDERASMLNRLGNADNEDESSSSTTNGDVLFQCTIRRLPKLFDGTKSLMNVGIGDIVDVVEEGVGPDGMYNMCKITKKVPDGEGTERMLLCEGWFPISCLEKLCEQ